ncbi:hypothetical protein ADUPG1_004425, partial [Aduncisulcus paluster]
SNKIWLTDGDALSYPTAITLAYSDQDPAAHTSCEYSEDSSFYPTANQPSNTVCKEVWSGVYRTECAMFSYRDYTASIPSCVSTLESNLNTQCVVSSAGGSIQSDCIEKWYGTGCDKECPLQDSALCGTPTYGSCKTTSHECECIGGYEGSACQYFAYDSLENFICAELAEDSTDNVTIADSESVTCVEVDGQYELPVTDFQYIVGLDLSTSGLASLSGLEHASNL